MILLTGGFSLTHAFAPLQIEKGSAPSIRLLKKLDQTKKQMQMCVASLFQADQLIKQIQQADSLSASTEIEKVAPSFHAYFGSLSL